MLDRRPKEEGTDEEEQGCFGDRKRETTDGDAALGFAARPARGTTRLLLPLVLGAADAQGRVSAGENVARDAMSLRRERGTKERKMGK